MDHYQFLLDYIEIIKINGFFDQTIKTPFALYVLSSDSSSDYSNFALVNSDLTDSQLLEIETFFAKKNRAPVIFFENSQENEQLKDFLHKNRYTKRLEDSWLFHDGNNIDEGRFNQVKVVETEEELQAFIETFDASYTKDDPQNPYGEVKEYLEATKNCFRKYTKEGVVEYYLAFKDNQPVATAILTNYQKIGYISGVGSLSKVRGEGFGKLVTLFAVLRSVRAGNKFHCLATEEGTYPHAFYQRIGFHPEFTAIGLIKKN